MRLRQKHSVMFLMLTESLNTISSVKMNYTSTVCVNRSRAKLHNSLLSCFVMMLTAEYFNYTSIMAQSVHMIPKLHLFSKQRGQQCQSVRQNCFINSFTLQAASIEHCGKKCFICWQWIGKISSLLWVSQADNNAAGWSAGYSRQARSHQQAWSYHKVWLMSN